MSSKSKAKEIRVIQLIDSLELGGAEVMAVNLSNLLDDNEVPVKLIATYRSGNALLRLKSNIEFDILGKSSATDFKAFKRLLNSIKKHRATHLHAHSTSIIWASIIKVLRPSIKLIWHDHNGMRESIQAGFKNEKLKDFEKSTSKEVVKTFVWSDRLTRFFSPLFYSVIVVNKTLQRYAQKNLWLSKKDIHYMDNFPYIQAIKDYSFEFGNRKNLIFVANLREQKSHDFFFGAVDELLGNNEDWQVLLVGNNPGDEWAKKIENLHNELRYKERVLMLGSRSDVHQLMLHSDLAILTSKSEGLPVTLLEYGLCRLPVVATNVGACAEVVANAEMIVEYGDRTSLVKTLNAFMSQPELRDSESNRYFNHISQKYASVAAFEKIKSIYGI